MKNENLNHAAAPVEELDGGDRFNQWVMAHIRPIAWVCGIILALVIVFFAVLYGYIKPQKAAADEDMAKAALYFQMGDFDKALNGDDADCIGFEAIADDYSWFKQGDLAAMYAGLCYFQKGDYESAASYLEKADLDDAIYGPAAKMHLGDAYVELGQNEDAISAYEKAVDAESTVISPVAAKKLGILLLQEGQKEEAHEAFLTIKNKYPESAEAQDIDMYIAYAE